MVEQCGEGEDSREDSEQRVDVDDLNSWVGLSIGVSLVVGVDSGDQIQEKEEAAEGVDCLNLWSLVAVAFRRNSSTHKYQSMVAPSQREDILHSSQGLSDGQNSDGKEDRAKCDEAKVDELVLIGALPFDSKSVDRS